MIVYVVSYSFKKRSSKYEGKHQLLEEPLLGLAQSWVINLLPHPLSGWAQE